MQTTETTRVRVRINPSKASGRTRRLLKSCGDEFDLYHNPGRTDSFLLRSVSSGWFGWIRADEIFYLVVKDEPEKIQ